MISITKRFAFSSRLARPAGFELYGDDANCEERKLLASADQSLNIVLGGKGGNRICYAILLGAGVERVDVRP